MEVCDNKSSAVPNRIRTGVIAVKGQCPRPLDDGDERTKILGVDLCDVKQ